MKFCKIEYLCVAKKNKNNFHSRLSLYGNYIQFFIVNAEKKIDKKYVETPLMKQYYSIKAVHPDAILLFRVGDFYETFGEDAIKASGILGITLTRRANGSNWRGSPTMPSTPTCPNWCGRASA